MFVFLFRKSSENSTKVRDHISNIIYNRYVRFKLDTNATKEGAEESKLMEVMDINIIRRQTSQITNVETFSFHFFFLLLDVVQWYHLVRELTCLPRV